MELTTINDDISNVWSAVFKSIDWTPSIKGKSNKVILVSKEFDDLIEIINKDALYKPSQPIKVVCIVANRNESGIDLMYYRDTNTMTIDRVDAPLQAHTACRSVPNILHTNSSVPHLVEIEFMRIYRPNIGEYCATDSIIGELKIFSTGTGLKVVDKDNNPIKSVNI